MCCLSSPIKECKPQAGADLCCGRTVRDMSVLSFGEYCPYPYNGFQCGCDHICITFFYGNFAQLFMKSEEKLRVNFLIGFVAAMVGIILISFDGSALELSPVGDMLAVTAAFVWACYSILTRKISSFGYPVILTARRTFLYGIFFMIPTLFFFDFEMEPARFQNMTQYSLFRIGCICPLLCDMEYCRQAVRCGKDECVYLHGACDHGGNFRVGA